MFLRPLLLLACLPLFAAPPVPGVVNHWVANTGGNPYDRIQNFIEDMTVAPDGTVYTRSFYDETGHQNGVYKNGRSLGAALTVDTVAHPSRRATRGGVTWNIRNFWGRAFLGKVRPPVTDSLPWIESSDGRSIRSLVDPTALAFDRDGRLLVADNGPDQNIKIFDVSGSPRLVGTFGDSGGVFAGPVRGATGPKRFWGIRGLGVDSSGRLYVGCTGMPMQVGGGTHIRCFSGMGALDTLLWEVLGLSYVNTVDADPDSAGTSLQKNHTRFHMDWTKPPGQSWSFAAVTTDPFRYPDDPRLVHSLESVWFRRIHGRRFLFLDDMFGSSMTVIRFEENSEIGVPMVFLPVMDKMRDSSGDGWALDVRPMLPPATAGDYRRQMWHDDNGDGQVQKSEFHAYEMMFQNAKQLDVDDSGSIWWPGKPYLVEFPPGPLDKNGVLAYSVDSVRFWHLPFRVTSENNGTAIFCRYLPAQDAMIIATDGWQGMFSQVRRYDHWRERATRWKWQAPAADTLPETWKISIPIKYPADWSQSINPQVVDTCLFPITLTADKDFLYVGYVDKGPWGKRNGEVSVYRISDGHPVGWIAPGPETGLISGWFDLWHAINSYTMPSGEKLLMTEDDFAGHVNVYKWCPSEACTRKLPTGSEGIRLSQSGRSLKLDAADGETWKLTLRDPSGKVLWAGSGTGSHLWSPVPVRGLVIGSVTSSQGTVSRRWFLP